MEGAAVKPLGWKRPPLAKVENCQWQMLPHTIRHQRMTAFAIKTSFSDAVKGKDIMNVHLITGYRMFGNK